MKLTQEEIVDILQGDLETFNKFLDSYANHIVERVLKSIPMMIANLVKTSEGIVATVEQFYKDNPNLVSSKDIVGKVLEKLDAENPGSSIQELRQMAKPTIEQTQKVNGLNQEVTRPNIDKLSKDLNGII